MKINNILKSLRQSKNQTQNEIAMLLDVSLSSYQKYERDKNSVMPSLDVLVRIADLYNVSIDYLLGRSSDIKPFDLLAAQYELSESDIALIALFISLSKEERNAITNLFNKAGIHIEFNRNGE